MRVEVEKLVTETEGIDNVVSFGVKDPSLIFVMLCTKLYKDPVRTMVQEYMCNARDAHGEIDSNEAIEVTLPSSISPYLVIRDYGPGISVERMNTVFIFLGESTKKADDKQTGGFGIGAKIAWAYTDSFTVISVHNSVKREYMAFMGDGNIGNLTLLETSITDERDGVAIRIKIENRDFRRIEEAVDRVCYFWKVQPVVHGRSYYTDYKPAEHTDESLIRMVLPEFVVASKAPVVVVDGIPYSINDIRDNVPKFEAYLSYNSTLCFFVNTGDVDLAVNRENIRWTSRTKATITEIYDEYVEKFTQEINKLKDLKTMAEVNEAAKSLKGIMLEQHVQVPIIEDYLTAILHADEERIQYRIGSVDVRSCNFGGFSFSRHNSTLSNVRGSSLRSGYHTINENSYTVVVHSDNDKWPSRSSVYAVMVEKRVDRVTVVTVPEIEKCERLWEAGCHKLEYVKPEKQTVAKQRFKLLNGTSVEDLDEGNYCYYQFKEKHEYRDNKFIDSDSVKIDGSRYLIVIATQPQVPLMKDMLVPHVSKLISTLHTQQALGMAEVRRELSHLSMGKIERSKHLTSTNFRSAIRAYEDLFSFIVGNHSQLHSVELTQFVFAYYRYGVLTTSMNANNKWYDTSRKVRSAKAFFKMQSACLTEADTLFKLINKKYSFLNTVISSYSYGASPDNILKDIIEWVNSKN